MVFDGQAIKVEVQADGIAELRFDRGSEAVNKLDRLAFDELRRALDAIKACPAIKGLLITSAKDAFIVGADIFEFTGVFKKPETEIEAFVAGNSAIISKIAELPVPSVAAINGFALGGGFEAALAADYRVMSTAAKIGVPEIHLGLFPGYGGTMRLPRLIGLAAAADWIISGAQRNAEEARQAGAADAIAAPGDLQAAARALLQDAINDKAGWHARREAMKQNLGLSVQEAASLLSAAKTQAAKALPHYPAAQFAAGLLEKAASLESRAALALEAETFAKVAKTQAADSLVATFINEQAVKKAARRQAKDAAPVRKAAIAGAGVMGGGIACQSALSGVPVVLKDISQAALDIGLAEARKSLAKGIEQGRLTQEKGDRILGSIEPRLTYDGFAEADLAIEAVVEEAAVKQRVLREIEDVIKPSAILASNTSSLRIAALAGSLKRPENFLGMHFFNPVPRMPLVEVVRGPKTSARAIAAVMAYAMAMGKTPILVEDCPGFVVNRILTPYLIAFLHLVHEGVDFQEIDKAMEAFGWPMGPAYLSDVIGLDIAQHVIEIVSAGYVPRMNVPFETALQVLLRAGRLGQKNGHGFYKYERDPKGRPRKDVDPDAGRLLATRQPSGSRPLSADEITSRLMLPMILEASRCLEDRIAATPAEIDMCLVLGLGLPRYLGGALKYADWLGLQDIIARASRLESISPIYCASERLLTMAQRGEAFYP